MGRHPRVTMTRGRWRMCLFGFTYYLCAVIIFENIIAVVYWNSSVVPGVPVIAESEQSPFRFAGDPRNASRTGNAEENQSVGTGGENQSPDKGGAILIDAVKPEVVKPEVVKPEVVQSNSSLTNFSLSTIHVPSVEEQEREYYRVQEMRVNPYLYNFTLRPRVLCDNDTFMIILIHSHHPYTDRRDAIRRTWGSVTSNGTWPNLPGAMLEKLRLVFMLGTHKDPGLNELIREEWLKFDDIVQGDFYDSYRNMTLKSLLGLKVVSEHCPSAKFLLKNDDDMFINVPYLVKVLLGRTLTRAIMGPLNVGSRVYRNGKWKLGKTEFPFTHYPPYESGAAYLITCDIVRELFVTSEHVPSIFIDDVYITGILGRILNVTHARQEGFAYWTNKPPKVCDIVENRIISGTKMTPKLLLSTWKELRGGPSCGVVMSTQNSASKSP